MPPETIEAFRDHGIAQATLGEGLTEARRQLEELAALGISLDAATDELLADGVAKFVEPFRKLLQAIATKAAEMSPQSAAGAPVTR
jgi:transaldolase/transaldolase/glucose-6-phosphate isomerase